MKEKVVVGISGGVDSFMATQLLQDEGYEVIGVHLNLYGSIDEEKLQRISKDLGIEIHCFDGKEQFKKLIIDEFVDGYINGCTPNPCALCNGQVKWNLLEKAADCLGVKWLATGHYVNIVKHYDHVMIEKGVDPNKDQSYFLWAVKEETLRRSMTPLGKFTKAKVKEMALERGFIEMSQQKESMGVCFLAGKDYREFITDNSRSGFQNKIGNIYLLTGEQIGEHNGVLHYTVGQKRGLPLAPNGTPYYVNRIDALNNCLHVGLKNDLFVKEFIISDCNWINDEFLKKNNLLVKVRGLGLNPEGYASFEKIDSNSYKIMLESDAWAMAPSQPVAVYMDNLLIGGGVVIDFKEKKENI